jgi:DNA-nicking Smr family endonuclease
MSYYPKTSEESFEPDIELDLHGCSMVEAKEMLDEIFESGVYGSARIIVGKGMRSEHGAVLPSFVHNYLRHKRIDYSHAPDRQGGKGAYDVVIPL